MAFSRTGMRGGVLLAAIAIGVVAFGYAASALDDSALPKPVSFTVDSYSDAGESMCKDFQLTDDDLKAFFGAMKTAPEKQYVDDLHSPCKAFGTFALSGGETGKYVIQSSGIGEVKLGDDKAWIVFSEPTWKDPNAGNYFNEG